MSTSSPQAAPVPARAAATVVLLRDGAAGVEVLVLRRHSRSAFMPDAWVFPGGTVDDADRMMAPALRTDIDVAASAARLGCDRRMALGLHVAGIRETFEEAGILLGADRDGAPLDPQVLAATGAAAVRRGIDFAGWLSAVRIVADLGALVPWRRWVTPTSEPRRYDTAFFLAEAPEGQRAAHDRVETTGQRWVRPADALAEAETGAFTLVFPTARSLEELAAVPDTATALATAAAAPVVRAVQPHVTRGADGEAVILHPDDPGFPADADPVTGAW